jgi:hypothetical protein
MYVIFYVSLVIIIQIIVNASLISSKCGGQITENMRTAGIITFLPWVLIFGVLVLVLALFPGFKSAFSDVIGYYYVSKPATKLLNELFIDTNEEPPDDQLAIADTIVKICGNASIIINQIVPGNFDQYWSILTPLMKDKYKYEGPETDKMKNDLFDLSVTRDNIGESIWYIYTGLLLTLVVQFKINNYNCQDNQN